MADNKTVLYARVSTAEQTIDHQKEQAEKAGFALDEVIDDKGVSGVSTKLKDREGGKRLFDILRNGDVLVVRWLDRLGRNYEDVTETVREFLKSGVTVKTIIGGMTFDAHPRSDMQKAVQDALLAFMAAQASAQVQAQKEAQRAGIEHHKRTSPEKYRGRKPRYDREQLEAVIAEATAGTNQSQIAAKTGVHRNAVIRILKDPTAASAMLTKWEDAEAERDGDRGQAC
ncbi:recombinase family protein [Aliiruegeria sabulilitoris]|uniref:recombinase family protein n=1 Tax=Aliiruegeria sabulilitoris TaxID=1510458 RepID=UPI000829A884|nr:recombinase family protein [Aliiruegeria sabulilitoris]NDR56162.1 recombinase family protein [Pseudoruegeria sp. M32A2M]